jgi:hypothetical protein
MPATTRLLARFVKAAAVPRGFARFCRSAFVAAIGAAEFLGGVHDEYAFAAQCW